MADNKDGREFIRSLSFKDTVTGDIEKASLYVGNIVVWPDGRETELDQETYKSTFPDMSKKKPNVKKGRNEKKRKLNAKEKKLRKLPVSNG